VAPSSARKYAVTVTVRVPAPCTSDEHCRKYEGADCAPDPRCQASSCTAPHRTVCEPAGDSFVCRCDPGYHEEGADCVLDSPCSPNPCTATHRTVCLAAAGSFTCQCDAGFHDDGGACTADVTCDAATTCSGHGTCAGSGLACACAAGYAGDHCEACAAGFHAAGGGCVADSVCDPNPCTTVHKAVCVDDGHGSSTCSCDSGYQDQDGNGTCLADCNTAGLACGAHGHCAIVAGAAACACDTGYTGAACDGCAGGYQDNDHNGTCLPTCATANLSCGALACSDASGTATCAGTRSCGTTVVYDPGATSITKLYLRGENNAWGLTTPMTLGSDGKWKVTVNLAAGDYGYKLYDQGRDSWFLDPKNPYFKWISNQQNSRLHVPDCNQPLLQLVGQPQVNAAAGTVSFQVQYIDGNAGSGVNATSAVATRNGTTLSGAFNASTGIFTVNDTALASSPTTSPPATPRGARRTGSTCRSGSRTRPSPGRTRSCTSP
jgi:hypothetical protein